MRHDPNKPYVFRADAVKVGGLSMRAVRMNDVAELCIQIDDPAMTFKLEEHRGRARWVFWTAKQILRSPKKGKA